MSLPDRLCQFLGKHIGDAQGESPFVLYKGEDPIPLYECKLKKAHYQGVAGQGTEIPLKKFCRVASSLELQAECRKLNSILPPSIPEYKK